MERTEWKPLMPKSSVGLYGSEAEKIYPKIEKYLHGVIFDVGCGANKITKDAIGFDRRQLDGVNFVCTEFSENSEFNDVADVLFSAHCLEHVPNDYAKLMEWRRLLKEGGTLILYLPDGRYYDNYENPDHIRDYNYETFMQFFERAFCGMGNIPEKYFEVIESGLDIGEDKYSFFIAAKKV